MLICHILLQFCHSIQAILTFFLFEFAACSVLSLFLTTTGMSAIFRFNNSFCGLIPSTWIRSASRRTKSLRVSIFYFIQCCYYMITASKGTCHTRAPTSENFTIGLCCNPKFFFLIYRHRGVIAEYPSTFETSTC